MSAAGHEAGFVAARPPTPSPADLRLVEALRNGDEAAFVSVVDRYHPAMLRLARLYVRDHAVAEDVVQETWLGVLRALDRFEGRSSLKTWIFGILLNVARTRAARDAVSVPFSALFDGSGEREASVDPERFRPGGHRWGGHWASSPARWDELPEERLLARETLSKVAEAIERLPPSQREVITLRDVEGWSAEEVCSLLAISETNQRVLLHRARTKVRRALETHLAEGVTAR